jgi:hypothetical protein
MTTVPAPVNPGKTTGIVAFVLSLLGLNLVGIIVGFVGLNQSKKAGQKNGFAVAGIVIGVISLVAIVVVIASGNAIIEGVLASFNGA